MLEGGVEEGGGGGRFHDLPLIEDGKLLESQPRGRRAPRLYASRSRPVPCIWPMGDCTSPLGGERDDVSSELRRCAPHSEFA